ATGMGATGMGSAGRGIMPQMCTVCRHRKVHDINEALLVNDHFGSLRNKPEQAQQPSIDIKKDHIAAALVQSKQAACLVNAEAFFDRLRSINRETAAVLKEARESKSNGFGIDGDGPRGETDRT